MTEDELCYLPATELAALMRRREVSPVEVVRVFLDRMQRLDRQLGAYCTPTPDLALAAAQEAEAALVRGDAAGSLHGVPVSVKDLIATRGVRTTRGSAIYADFVPDGDAPLVERLCAAGAISLGKTNTPEFGWKGATDNRIFPPTRNPWHPERTAGGSSGGAGAAVAAGLGPIGIGTDGGGSIRIPAALCGVVGLKPSFGLIPISPASAAEPLSHAGPLTRTVADAALALDVMAGPDERDRNSLPALPEHGRYLAAARAGARDGLNGLRIAWSATLGYGRVHPEVAALAEQAARRFESLGCAVEAADPGFSDPGEAWDTIFYSGIGAALAGYLPEWRDRMDSGLVQIVEKSAALTAYDYARAGFARVALWERVRQFFGPPSPLEGDAPGVRGGYDLLLTPAVAVPAFPLGEYPPRGWSQELSESVAGDARGGADDNSSGMARPARALGLPNWTPFTYPFNLTGQPACSVPCGWTSEGLPAGLQIVGRRFADATVLRAAAAFEAAAPWHQRRPPMSSANSPPSSL